MGRSEAEIRDLERRLQAVSSWYHAIDLGDGIRTPGPFDMARYLPAFRLPDRLDGLRVLDVGASTGFFSYEFERRGAAEVIALELPSWADCDWTPRYRADHATKSDEERRYIDDTVMRAGFDLVGEALGSKVVRKVEMKIYDIAPEVLGEFDLVFCGMMLMHVRDPVLGLQRMRSVCKPDGEIIVSIAAYQAEGDAPVARFAGEWNQCNWWHMSPACLREMLRCCDFVVDEARDGTFTLENEGGGFVDPAYVCHARPRREGE